MSSHSHNATPFRMAQRQRQGPGQLLTLEVVIRCAVGDPARAAVSGRAGRVVHRVPACAEEPGLGPPAVVRTRGKMPKDAATARISRHGRERISYP